MKEMQYYNYEKKNKCPKCGGDLRYIGTLNYTDQLECANCHQEFLVDEIYKMKTDGSIGFFGYENFRELRILES